MRIVSLIASLGDNHPPSPTSTHLRVLDPTQASLALSCRILTCVRLPPPLLSPTHRALVCSYPPALDLMRNQMIWGVDDPTSPLINPQRQVLMCSYLPASVSTRNATNRRVYNPLPLLPAMIRHESISSSPPLMNSHQSLPGSNECVSI